MYPLSPSRFVRCCVLCCAVTAAGMACGGSASEPQAPEEAAPEEAAPEPAEVTAPRVESTPESNTLPVSGAAPEEAPAGPGASGSPARGKRAPCTTDQSCNDDPAVSALWGRCTPLGVCECKDGFERSPASDLCRPEDAD